MTALQRPLYKKGDPADPSNYRAISLLSCVGKVFEKVLESRLRVLLESRDLIDGLQHGFVPGRSAEQHVLLLDALLRRTGRGTPAVFVDIKKAFPSVRRSSLMGALWEAGVRGNLYRTIQQIYETNRSTISVGRARAAPYSAGRGVREGAILSPVLFLIFINGLLRRLRRLGRGPTVRGRYASVLGFADDLVLLGFALREDPTGAALQAMLDVVGDFAVSHDIEFGYDKTRAVLFRPGPRLRIPAPALRLLRMSGRRAVGVGADDPHVLYERSAFYLGVLFTDTLSWAPHIRKLLASIKRMASALKSTVLRPDVVPPVTAIDTVRTLLLSKATYGVAVWGPSVFWPAGYRRACPWPAGSLRDLDRVFTGCIRTALALPHHTATIAVWREAGWFGFSRAVAVKLLAMLNSVNKLPARHAMRVTLQEACAHLSADPSDRNDTGAYRNWTPLPFVLHIRALGEGLGLRAVIDTALTGVLRPWPKNEMRHVRDGPLRTAMTARCEALLQRHTCAAHYPAGVPWELSADLACVRASDLSLSYLTVAKMRANVHMLGSTVARLSQQGAAGPVRCPACGMPEPDDPDHAFFRCRHPGLAALRARFLPVAFCATAGAPPLGPGVSGPCPSRVSRLLYRGRLLRTPTLPDERWKAVVAWCAGIKAAHPVWSAQAGRDRPFSARTQTLCRRGPDPTPGDG